MPCGVAGDGRTPEQTIDSFHRALRTKNTSLALSLLSRKVVIYEQGSADRSRRDYAANHLPGDIEKARARKRTLVTRRTGGSEGQRWVLSTYRVTSGERVLTESETVIMRRSGASWRIAHIHWSYTIPD